MSEPVAWMWQHDETGRTGFVEHAPPDELAQWERMNKPRKIVMPLYTTAEAGEIAELRAKAADYDRLAGRARDRRIALEGAANYIDALGGDSKKYRIALATTHPAGPKPLDNQHLQQLFGDAIEGALAFGFQGNNEPPAGHWLWRFWNIGNAERANILTQAIQRLNQNSYSLTKGECIDILSEMRAKATGGATPDAGSTG